MLERCPSGSRSDEAGPRSKNAWTAPPPRCCLARTRHRRASGTPAKSTSEGSPSSATAISVAVATNQASPLEPARPSAAGSSTTPAGRVATRGSFFLGAPCRRLGWTRRASPRGRLRAHRGPGPRRASARGRAESLTTRRRGSVVSGLRRGTVDLASSCSAIARAFSATHRTRTVVPSSAPTDQVSSTAPGCQVTTEIASGAPWTEAAVSTARTSSKMPPTSVSTAGGSLIVMLTSGNAAVR